MLNKIKAAFKALFSTKTDQDTLIQHGTTFDSLIEKNREIAANLAKSSNLQTPLTEVFIDPATADVYYAYTDITKLPLQRQIKWFEHLLLFQFGLSGEYITDYKQRMQAAIQAGNMAAVSQLQQHFETRTAFVLPQLEDVYIRCAALFVVRHDENPLGYNAHAEQAKLEAAQKSVELRSFFLSVCWELLAANTDLKAKLKGLNLNSEQDFTNYLHKQRNSNRRNA